MDEYIKRSDVLSLKHRLHNHSKDTIELYPVYVISPDAVEKIPSADVVEVVRCKDCIHRPLHIDGERPDSPYIDDDCCYKDYTCPYLCDDDYYNRMPDDNWFCNHGERMDGGT